MVLGAPAVVNIPCFMQNTRLVRLGVLMTNNSARNYKDVNTKHVMMLKAGIHLHNIYVKFKDQTLDGYLIMNSLGDNDINREDLFDPVIEI